MTQFFEYNAFPEGDNKRMAGPLWPDFNPQSDMSKKMVNAKRVNDSTFWNKMREVFAHDIETLPLERFKAWASVMTVPLMSNSKHSQYIRIALNALTKDEVYANALLEPKIGMNDEDFSSFYNMFSDFPTTMNRIQCYSHLAICGYDKDFLKDAKKIVEIGAGVGDMADIIHKLGFEGEYVIYDLPELCKIQEWYHTQLGMDILHTNEVDDLLEDADLVIATWSLTEMPFELRESVVSKLLTTKNWLLAYSKEIFGFDNEEWIQNFIERFPNSHINITEIPFMGWDGGTNYLTIKA